MLLPLTTRFQQSLVQVIVKHHRNNILAPLSVHASSSSSSSLSSSSSSSSSLKWAWELGMGMGPDILGIIYVVGILLSKYLIRYHFISFDTTFNEILFDQ
mmetsp:Transcript_26262/g.30011  ORF Transcript_26262/g.30011 Transcript_26262/m.30011 type:complete len:100 (+) Transcript_26262:115-414(+)